MMANIFFQVAFDPLDDEGYSVLSASPRGTAKVGKNQCRYEQ